MPSVAMRFTSDWTTSDGPIGATFVSPRVVGTELAQPASSNTVKGRAKGAATPRDARIGRDATAQRAGVPGCAGVCSKPLDSSTR